MKRRLNELVNSVVRARDGVVGTVQNFYFDDVTWSIRYLVVETGKWLENRRVLVSVVSVGVPDWGSRTFPVDLTREQVRNSPKIDTADAVSRQYEASLIDHYGWPIYWQEGFYYPPLSVAAVLPLKAKETEEETVPPLRRSDPHLQSMRDVAGCQIHATDGNIGHAEDFIVDDTEWAIRYLVVDTRNWLPGRRVLVSPQWIEKIVWEDRKIIVDLSRHAVEGCPVFDPSKPYSIDYETRLHAHLRKPEVMVWVEFKFHGPLGADVHLAGTFNNWDPASITLAGDGRGIYTTAMLLPVGTYEYKFIVNGEWRNAHGDRDRVPNPFGTANNVLVVRAEPHQKVHTPWSLPDNKVSSFIGSGSRIA